MMKKLAAGVALLIVLCAVPVAADTLVLKHGVGGYSGTTDAYIDSQSPDTNYGTPWYMHVYMYNNAPRRSGLIRFDLTGRIPPMSIIHSATLSLWCYQVVDMDSNDYLYVAPFRVGQYRPWVETEATWNRFRGTSYWSSPGCEGWQWGDRSQTYDGTPVLFTKDSQVNRYYHWDVTASVQAWYQGTANNGWLLRATSHDGVAGEGVSFNTREGGIDYRPYLTIQYTVIPEPGSLTALMAGVATLLCRRRKKSA